MKLKNLDPNSPEVIARAVERIRRMTPEEALAFLNYRTHGVEETDMMGMLQEQPQRQRTVRAKRNTTIA